MIPGVEDREGWIWPVKDSKCWNWLQNEKDLPKEIASKVPRKGVCVQAGGNCGFYPKQYGEIFERVYTFEPDWMNFYCLTMNASAPNIIKQQACLGDERKLLALSDSAKNVGCYAVVPSKTGVHPTLMIDDLGLDACDLIHLDIEGWEFPALRGAIKTIERFRPVVVLEWMGHGEKFGFMNADVEAWMEARGYKRSEMVMHDKVWYP